MQILEFAVFLPRGTAKRGPACYGIKTGPHSGGNMKISWDEILECTQAVLLIIGNLIILGGAAFLAYIGLRAIISN